MFGHDLKSSYSIYSYKQNSGLQAEKLQVALAKRRNRRACLERLQGHLLGLQKKIEAQRCEDRRDGEVLSHACLDMFGLHYFVSIMFAASKMLA